MFVWPTSSPKITRMLGFFAGAWACAAGSGEREPESGCRSD